MYKYAHLFEDQKGQFCVLSNKSKKPNPKNAKFFPIGSENSKYLGAKSLQEVNQEYLSDLIYWGKKYYRKNINVCWFVPTQFDIDQANNILKFQKMGVIDNGINKIGF